MKNCFLYILLGLPACLFAQWQPTTGPLGAGHISSLASAGSTIFAGTQTGGIFTSANNGILWTASNTGLTNLNDVRGLCIDGNNVFAGVFNSMADTAVFMSGNNGASWNKIGLTGLFLMSLASKPGYLIAGTWYGVEYTTNNGATWTASSSGLPSNASVSALAFSGNKIFAGVSYSSSGGTGVFASVNNGASWSAFNTNLGSPQVNSIAVLGSQVYMGATGSGVYKSPVGSASWTSMNTGLTNTNVRTLCVIGTSIFAGTDNGLFISDGGTGWNDISTGLPSGTKVYSITSDAAYLYAGCDSMVWRRPLAELSLGMPDPQRTPFLAAYPNPAGNSVTLCSDEAIGQVMITDVCGRVVLSAGELKQDTQQFDLSGIAPGYYTICVLNATGVHVLRLVKAAP
jgi:hypothetical protein